MPPTGRTTPSVDVLDELDKLRRRISELERQTLRNVVIPEGGLRLRGGGQFVAETPTGVEMFYLGELHVGAEDFRGIWMKREDGSFMFYNGLADGDPNKVFFAWLDRAGNILVSDDGSSGQGLARPWLMMPTVNVIGTSIPTTTSAAFVSTQSTGWVIKQQPKCDVQALLLSNGGGTGNARFTINGTPTGPVLPIAAGAFAWSSIHTLTLPGTYNSYVRVELQVQLTNGTGSVGGVLIATQRQT